MEDIIARSPKPPRFDARTDETRPCGFNSASKSTSHGRGSSIQDQNRLDTAVACQFKTRITSTRPWLVNSRPELPRHGRYLVNSSIKAEGFPSKQAVLPNLCNFLKNPMVFGRVKRKHQRK